MSEESLRSRIEALPVYTDPEDPLHGRVVRLADLRAALSGGDNPHECEATRQVDEVRARCDELLASDCDWTPATVRAAIREIRAPLSGGDTPGPALTGS